MKNLRDQDGCWNCLNLYCLSEQDEHDQFFCNVTKDRPRSGRCCAGGFHDECFLHDAEGKDVSPDEFTERADIWQEWREGKEVRPFKICDNWSHDPKRKG